MRYQTDSLYYEIPQLIANAMLSKLLSLAFGYYIKPKKYRMEVGGGSLYSFVTVVAWIELPFLMFPVREVLFLCYGYAVTIFLVRNNIA
jgi:hypothetical protein